MSTNTDVAWWGTWQHAACGATGEVQWDDEDTASSGHECGQSGEVTWSAEWDCHGCCASGGVETFDDDTPAYSGHECDDGDENQAPGVVA